MADDTEGTDIPSMLLPCVSCNRTFRPEALAKHSKVCEKSLMKKRKKFDSSKQRIQGTDLAEFLPILPTFTKKVEKSPVRKTQTPPSKLRSASESTLTHQKTKWRDKHNELVQTIQAARLPPGQAPAMPIKPVDQEQCPYCERTFGPKAYDRHLEWCKEQRIRIQPKSPASQRAKERLEARTKYRAPMMNKTKRSASRDKLPGGKREPSPSPTITSHQATTLTPVMTRRTTYTAAAPSDNSTPNINRTFVKGTPLRSSTRGSSSSKKTPQQTRLEDIPTPNSYLPVNVEEVNKAAELDITRIWVPRLVVDGRGVNDKSVSPKKEASFTSTYEINFPSEFINCSRQQSNSKEINGKTPIGVKKLSETFPQEKKPRLVNKRSYVKLSSGNAQKTEQNDITNFPNETVVTDFEKLPQTLPQKTKPYKIIQSIPQKMKQNYITDFSNEKVITDFEKLLETLPQETKQSSSEKLFRRIHQETKLNPICDFPLKQFPNESKQSYIFIEHFTKHLTSSPREEENTKTTQRCEKTSKTVSNYHVITKQDNSNFCTSLRQFETVHYLTDEVILTESILCYLNQNCNADLSKTSMDSFNPKSYNKSDEKMVFKCYEINENSQQNKTDSDLSIVSIFKQSNFYFETQKLCKSILDGNNISNTNTICPSSNTDQSLEKSIFQTASLEMLKINYFKNNLISEAVTYIKSRLPEEQLRCDSAKSSPLSVLSADKRSDSSVLFVRNTCCKNKSYFLDFIGTKQTFCPGLIFLVKEINLNLPHLNIAVVDNDDISKQLLSNYSSVCDTQRNIINIRPTHFLALKLLYSRYKNIFMIIPIMNSPTNQIYEGNFKNFHFGVSSQENDETFGCVTNEDIQLDLRKERIGSQQMSHSNENCQFNHLLNPPPVKGIKIVASMLDLNKCDNTVLSEYESGTFWDYYGTGNIHVNKEFSEENFSEENNSDSDENDEGLFVDKFGNLVNQTYESDEQSEKYFLTDSEETEFFLQHGIRYGNSSYFSYDSLDSKIDISDNLTENSDNESDGSATLDSDEDKLGGVETQESGFSGYFSEMLPKFATNKTQSYSGRRYSEFLAMEGAKNSTEWCTCCIHKPSMPLSVSEAMECFFKNSKRQQTNDINRINDKFLCLNNRKTKIIQPTKLPKICSSQNNLSINSSGLLYSSSREALDDLEGTFISKRYQHSDNHLGSKLPEIKQLTSEQNGIKKTHWTEKFNQLKEKQKNNNETQKHFLEPQGMGATRRDNERTVNSFGEFSRNYISSNTDVGNQMIGKKKLLPIVPESRSPKKSLCCRNNSSIPLSEDLTEGQVVTIRRSYLDSVTLSIFKPGIQQYVPPLPCNRPKNHSPEYCHKATGDWMEKNHDKQTTSKKQRMRFPYAVKKVVTQITKRRIYPCRPEDPPILQHDMDLRTVGQSGGPDSAYSSLNRKSPVGGEGDQEKEASSCSSMESSAIARFCHECGAKYPVVAAKFCCQCGVRRLII